MKPIKTDAVVTAKSTSAAPLSRPAAAPKTSFAETLAAKIQPPAVADEEAKRAQLEQAKKEMGTVLMRGILAAPKMKKLEGVQAEDGLSDD